MTRHEARERVIHTVAARVQKVARFQSFKAQLPTQAETVAKESEPYSPPEHHHIISQSLNSTRNMYSFISENKDDPAVKVSSRLQIPLIAS